MILNWFKINTDLITKMKISVLLSTSLNPTVNDATKEQLIRAIYSFSVQTHPHKELIVIAYNCPLTKRVVETFSFAFSEIKCIFVRDSSSSISKGLKIALEHASGDLICYLQATDILAPSHLKNIAKNWTSITSSFITPLKCILNRCRLMHPMVFKINSGFSDPYVRPQSVDDIKTKDLERYGIVDPLFVVIETPKDAWIIDLTTLVHVRNDAVNFESIGEHLIQMNQESPCVGQFYSETYIIGKYKNLWNL